MELKLNEEDRARLESRTFGPEEMCSAVGAARLGPAIQIDIDAYYGEHKDMGVLETDYAASMKAFMDEHKVSPGDMLGIFRLGVFMCKVHGKLPMNASVQRFARRKS